MIGDLDEIARRVREVEPVRAGEPGAAVAAILRRGAGGRPEVLLIRRAERAGDPWSGHMAFPGGRRERGDPTLEHTARRETLEEVGLDLDASGALVGPLHDVPTHRPGLVVRPFVYRLEGPAPLRPNHEVAATDWADLEALASGARDTTHPLEWGGQLHHFPAYRVERGVVWGLTYRMLQIFFEVLRSA